MTIIFLWIFFAKMKTTRRLLIISQNSLRLLEKKSSFSRTSQVLSSSKLLLVVYRGLRVRSRTFVDPVLAWGAILTVFHRRRAWTKDCFRWKNWLPAKNFLMVLMNVLPTDTIIAVPSPTTSSESVTRWSSTYAKTLDAKNFRKRRVFTIKNGSFLYNILSNVQWKLLLLRL